MSEVRVWIDTEGYGPTVEIGEIIYPERDQGFAIPAEMWRDLCQAQDSLTAAENAILRYVAERYPHSAAREWMERRT